MSNNCFARLLRSALLAAFVATAFPCSAEIYRVKWDSPSSGPGDDWANAYHTIGEAMGVAQEGDQIWVAGIESAPYLEKVDLKNEVQLYGGFAGAESDLSERNYSANVTVIDGSSADIVVEVGIGASRNTVLDGFTITNSGGAYAGVYCYGSSPTISNNQLWGHNNNGIACEVGSDALIQNNVVSGCGVGILVSASSPEITGNYLTSNLYYGINLDQSYSSVYSNTVTSTAGGIYCQYSSYPYISGNSIYGCGNGIFSYESTAQVSSNYLQGNGTGVYCYGGQTDVYINYITDNYAGVANDVSSRARIRSNLICFNTDGITSYVSQPEISNNTISDNYGRGVYFDSDSSGTLVNNIVAFSPQGIVSDAPAGEVTSDFNCVHTPGGTGYTGVSAGASDIGDDPLFRDKDSRDYSLQPLSPCINTGTNAPVQPWDTDIDYQQRIIPANGRTDIGADEAPAFSIEEAKRQYDNTRVYVGLSKKLIVTGVFLQHDAYYVEEEDRSSGLRVDIVEGYGFEPQGTSGVLVGSMTTFGGERALTNASFLPGTVTPADVPRPLGMLTRDAAKTPPSPFGPPAIGLCARGLLSTISGKVTYVAPFGGYIVIDDGSSSGGAPLETPEGHPGISVWITFVLPPGLSAGDYATVTGVSSTYLWDGSDPIPMLLPRSAADLVVH